MFGSRGKLIGSASGQREHIETNHLQYQPSPDLSSSNIFQIRFFLLNYSRCSNLFSSIILYAPICPVQLYHMPQFVLFNYLKCPDLSFSIISTELTCPLQLYHMPQFVLFNTLKCPDLSFSIISTALTYPVQLSDMPDLSSSITSYAPICPLQ